MIFLLNLIVAVIFISLEIECIISDLCNPELCPPPPLGAHPVQCGKCGPLNLEVTDHLCRQRKLTAVKTIRICEADWLSDIKAKMDLKIVHLIRDPRALWRSSLGSKNNTSSDLLHFHEHKNLPRNLVLATNCRMHCFFTVGGSLFGVPFVAKEWLVLYNILYSEITKSATPTGISGLTLENFRF